MTVTGIVTVVMQSQLKFSNFLKTISHLQILDLEEMFSQGSEEKKEMEKILKSKESELRTCNAGMLSKHNQFREVEYPALKDSWTC